MVRSLFVVFLAFAAGAHGKLPPGTSWTSFASSKPVYSRSLGPPGVSGMGTITVPYMPKPSFFPKLVDPRIMISKKTDMLSNIFGGMGPVDYPGYGTAGSSLYSTYSGKDEDTADLKNNMDKDESIVTNKNVPYTESGLYKRGMFGPVGPKFPFGGMSKFGPSSFGGVEESRRKRSIDDTSTMLSNYKSNSESKTDTKDAGPPPPPPPYPGLGPIAEEPEPTEQKILEKMFDPSSAGTIPKEYLPGMFGPVVDPSIFAAKKSAFLDMLFNTLATSTPSPVTEIPVPKSTIVPPSFWYPTLSIPSPGAYDAKVTEFLNKLFDSLNLNNTSVDTNSVYPKENFARSAVFESGEGKSKVARSLDNVAAIAIAKDSIVDSILSELGNLKANMVNTLDDLITYEKTATPPLPIGMKPFKPFPPGLFPKPLVDGTLPYKQRMTILSNVFDMLTELQKNITAAVQEAVVSKKADVTATPIYNNPANEADTSSDFNLTLLDAIKSKLASLNTTDYPTIPKKTMRMLPKSPTSFWVAYPQSSSATAKRDVSEDDIDIPDVYEEDHHNRDQYTRAIKMQMHQGYQSLPPGTVESVQAGGGSVPGHQGGGIKMLDTKDYGDFEKWVNWQNFLRKESQGQRHHHDHH